MKDILHLMLNEKGQPCLSIVLATRRLSPERELNPEIIRKGISKAMALIDTSDVWPVEQMDLLTEKLSVIKESIDTNHLMDGLGIYISPNLSEVVHFPFEVKEKIMLKNSFETRDVGYLNQVTEDYLVLSLSKKEIHLFKSSTHGLLEIENEDFPMVFHEEYEYAKPARGLSYSSEAKGFVPDNSITKEMRQIIFLRAVDEKLKHYLMNNMMFVISGVKEVISGFMSVSKHASSLAGKIVGNYTHVHPELDKLARKSFMDFKATKKQELINNMHELVGKRTAAIGLPEVWKKAYEGKGLTLAVEKDFVCRGYVLPQHEQELHLTPPKGKYEVINDAVDDVIEKVLEKKGEVVFVDDSDLSDMGHIAMTLRYK